MLIDDLRATLSSPPPLPGQGRTPERHHILFELGRRDLSLARLAEAHWDAVAILAEAGQEAKPGAIYGVWASEIPGQALTLQTNRGNLTISGSKRFCTGSGLIDRALITVGSPEPRLVEIDLRESERTIHFDRSSWVTNAF